MQIQVDIPEEISKALIVYKVKHGLHDKREALVEVLKTFFNSSKFNYFLNDK